MKKIFILTMMIFILSCGTGPWFLSRKSYKFFKEPVSIMNNNLLQFNGIYLEVGELKENVDYRDYIIFYDNGYVLINSIDEEIWRDSLEIRLKNLMNKKLPYDWYKIVKDSIQIETFAYNRNEMFTWSFYYKGEILDDSIIKLNNPENVESYYKFFPVDSIPKYNSSAWYLKKKWYREGLHESRQ